MESSPLPCFPSYPLPFRQCFALHCIASCLQSSSSSQNILHSSLISSSISSILSQRSLCTSPVSHFFILSSARFLILFAAQFVRAAARLTIEERAFFLEFRSFFPLRFGDYFLGVSRAFRPASVEHCRAERVREWRRGREELESEPKKERNGKEKAREAKESCNVCRLKMTQPLFCSFCFCFVSEKGPFLCAQTEQQHCIISHRALHSHFFENIDKAFFNLDVKSTRKS